VIMDKEVPEVRVEGPLVVETPRQEQADETRTGEPLQFSR
jgi:hypothetical protein